MIYNNNTIYAKVWKITPSENGKYIDYQITTSEKDQDGNYKNSSWFPRAIGKAVNQLKNLNEGDRITITKSKFTNERFTDKDGKIRSSFRFLILEAEPEITDNNPTNNTAVNTTSAADDVQTDEDSPW